MEDILHGLGTFIGTYPDLWLLGNAVCIFAIAALKLWAARLNKKREELERGTNDSED